MIAFRVKGGFLDLYPDTDHTLVWSNPVFDANNLARAFSWEVNLPRTPNNNALLQHLYRIDTTKPNRSTDCEVFINGLSALLGVIKISEVGSDYVMYFQSNSLAVADILKNDLSYFITDSVQLFEDGATGLGLQWICAFQNNAYYPEYTNATLTIDTYSFNISYTDTDDRNLIATQLASQITDAQIPGVQASASGDNCIIYSNTAHQVSGGGGIFVFGNYGGAEYTHQRIVAKINTIVADVANQPIVFPYIQAPKVNKNGSLSINTYDETGIQRNVVSTTSGQSRNSVVPMLKVAYVVKKIAEKFGFTIAGEVWNDAEFQNKIIFNSVTLDDEQTFIDPLHPAGGDKQFLNVWKQSFLLSDHLPKMSALDFLNALSKEFGAYFWVDRTTLKLRRKSDLINLRPINITDEIDYNSIRHFPITKKTISILYKHETNTEGYEAEFDAFTVPRLNLPTEPEVLQFEIPFDTLPMMGFSNIGGFRRIPYYQGEADKTYKALLSFRGNYPLNSTGNAIYQYATSDNLDHQGAVITGAKSLCISTSVGIYENYLKYTIEYEDATQIDVQSALSFTKLLQAYNFEFVKVLAISPLGQFESTVKRITIKLRPTLEKSTTLIETLKV